MARATVAAKVDRTNQLQRMILSGSSKTECISYARQAWEISRPRAYTLLKPTWPQIHADVDKVGVESAELITWAIVQLQSATGRALKQRNQGAFVGVVRQLHQLCCLRRETAFMVSYHCLDIGDCGLSFRDY